ncbi:hypothetical protein QN277_022590 [Acacia crassicarpa]|uniref:Uncharacterized protein n=1 Tax=Acacia crassicarpa TaxID=499986 RepID=A0AAE1JIY3_9FABA|nr:hypothetical protein QN277_022590 [Acacia crassicarpa]
MVILRTLWRKMKKEKKRFFRGSSPTVHNVQYDIDSYSHNFDDGYSSDPDDASRSFSARFAIPFSRSFVKSCELSSDDDNCSEMSC